MSNTKPIRGVCCPACGSTSSRVYSVHKPMRGRTVRYRVCLKCEKRFSTAETVQIKRNA
jgi:transcriptional regulator NrdR family protein